MLKQLDLVEMYLDSGVSLHRMMCTQVIENVISDPLLHPQ